LQVLGGECFGEAGFKAAHKKIYDMCSSARDEDGSKIRIDMNHLLYFDRSRSMVKPVGGQAYGLVCEGDAHY
jgi:hypothetical protein